MMLCDYGATMSSKKPEARNRLSFRLTVFLSSTSFRGFVDRLQVGGVLSLAFAVYTVRGQQPASAGLSASRDARVRKYF